MYFHKHLCFWITLQNPRQPFQLKMNVKFANPLIYSRSHWKRSTGRTEGKSNYRTEKMNIEGLYYKIIAFAIWSNITKPEFWEFLVQPARKVISSSQFLCLCLSVGSMSQTPRPYCLSAVSYWLYNLGRDLMDFFSFLLFVIPQP